MTYKFVTREEIEDWFRNKPFTLNICRALLSERDEALKRCAAYREVAIREDLISTNPSASRKAVEEYADAEAARIMSAKEARGK